jgi:hypothetical protein
VQTDAFYENGHKINKGKGINEGLKHLDMDGWVVHLDSDIYLPPLTRQILENLDLDNETLYGIDRMMCPSYESWINFIDSPKPMHEGWIYVHTTAFPLGVRIAEYKNKGWEPIGFFQMWNPKASNVLEYPKEHGEVDRSDVIFAKKFRRAKRQLIPEIISIHIDSEELPEMGKNWSGRKTRPFTMESVVKKASQEIPAVASKKGYIPNFINKVIKILKVAGIIILAALAACLLLL